MGLLDLGAGPTISGERLPAAYAVIVSLDDALHGVSKPLALGGGGHPAQHQVATLVEEGQVVWGDPDGQGLSPVIDKRGIGRWKLTPQACGPGHSGTLRGAPATREPGHRAESSGPIGWKTATSQIIGGTVGGIGQAMFEATRTDQRTGRITNATLADYLVPVNADVPDMEVLFVGDPDPATPVGTKGIGEIGLVGVAAAIANAVFHATGRRIRSLPITVDQLLL